MTGRFFHESFGYAITFQNLTKERNGRFVAFKNFTVDSEQSPFKLDPYRVPKPDEVSIQVECSGEKSQSFNGSVAASLKIINAANGDFLGTSQASFDDCGVERKTNFGVYNLGAVLKNSGL